MLLTTVESARKKTCLTRLCVSLDVAETETSLPKVGESGTQGGGPVITSSDLGDNNEYLIQTRGSSILGQGGTDHAGKKQTLPADLLQIKGVANVLQFPDGTDYCLGKG